MPLNPDPGVRGRQISELKSSIDYIVTPCHLFLLRILCLVIYPFIYLFYLLYKNNKGPVQHMECSHVSLPPSPQLSPHPFCLLPYCTL